MNKWNFFGKFISGNKVQKAIQQLFKFGIVGIVNNIISLTCYYIVVFIKKDWYLIGNVIGFLISTLNAWFMNSRYVFKENQKRKENSKETLIRTYLVYMVSLGISTALLYLFVDQLEVDERVAPIGCLMITIIFNFCMNKFWIYRSHTINQEKDRQN